MTTLPNAFINATLDLYNLGYQTTARRLWAQWDDQDFAELEEVCDQLLTFNSTNDKMKQIVATLTYEATQQQETVDA